MTRRNLSPNPALGVDVTGWGGGSSPTREAVSGFVRPWAARYLASVSFIRLPVFPVTQGLTYTLSVYCRINTIFLTAQVNSYVGFYTSPTFQDASFFPLTLPPFNPNEPTRLSRTSIAEVRPGVAWMDVIFDGWGGQHDSLDFTAALYEQTGVVDGYADGSSAGWVWDGVPELSSSTESGGATRGTASPRDRQTSSALSVSRTAPSMATFGRTAPSMQKGTS